MAHCLRHDAASEFTAGKPCRSRCSHFATSDGAGTLARAEKRATRWVRHAYPTSGHAAGLRAGQPRLWLPSRFPDLRPAPRPGLASRSHPSAPRESWQPQSLRRRRQPSPASHVTTARYVAVGQPLRSVGTTGRDKGRLRGRPLRRQCPRRGGSRNWVARPTAPGPGADVAHHGARRPVAGLGHNHLERDLVVADLRR